MSDLVKELRESTLKQVSNLPLEYRCHEVARLIKKKLISSNLNIIIRDGIVTYDIPSLIKTFFSFGEFLEGLEDEALAGETKKKHRIIHSWCEVEERDSQDSVIIIDWHSLITLSCVSLEGVLIVENKKNLSHKYDPTGRLIGKWIIFKKFPLIFTRLNLQEAQ